MEDILRVGGGAGCIRCRKQVVKACPLDSHESLRDNPAFASGWPGAREGLHMRPSKNPYGLNNFLHRWAKDNPPELTFKAKRKADAEKWQQAFRRVLRRSLGPMPEEGRIRARVAEVKQFKGFRREKVYLDVSPWHELPLYLLIPDGAKDAPVVLALHGHGGSAGLLNLRGKEDPRYRKYGVRYVERGFVVATPDFYPFGERIQPDHSGEGDEVRCNARFVTAMLYGFTTLGLNVCDVMRTVDYLGKRREADIGRLGCMGLSYGGTVAMYATAMDRRIQRTVLSCSFGAMAGHGLFLDELCGGQVVPGILRYGDMAEIAGCIAPRPLLLECATNDRCFPWKATRSELPRLKKIYEAFRASEHLRVDVFKDGHRFYGDHALEWFEPLKAGK